MTAIGNRLLDNSYNGTLLKDNEVKIVENKGTQTDQVLDLSGTPEQIALEISTQDISSIKAIKVNNSLVKLNPKQIESLVEDLRSKCLDSNSQLKPDIKFANFQAVTGQDKIPKVQINAVESTMNIDTIKKMDESYQAATSTLSLDMNVLNPGGNLPDQHSGKAVAIGRQIKKVGTLITDMTSEIDKLKLIPGKETEISQLQNKITTLGKVKDILSINKQIHESMTGQDPKAASVKLEALTINLAEKINDLKKTSSELGTDDKEIKGFISKSEKTCNNLIDLTHLCKNGSLLKSMQTMGKATTPAAVQLYFNEYAKLSQTGQEAKLKGRVEGRQGVGETPDAKGFINASSNDIRYDSALADSMNELADKILSNKFGSKGEMEAAVKKLFQTTSGKFVIPESKVDKVVAMFSKLYDANANSKDTQSIIGDIHKEGENLKGLKGELDKAKATQVQLLKNNVGIAGLGFGPKSVTSGQSVDQKSNTILNKTGDSIEVNGKVLDEEIKDSERTEMERVQNKVDGFLDDSPSSSFGVSIDSHLHLDISVKAGIGNKYAYAGVGVGISLDVRKVSTAAGNDGTAVVAKVGVHFLAEAGVNFKWLTVSAEVKKSFSVGIFFKEAKPLQEYTAQLVKVQSLAQKYQEYTSSGLDTSQIKSQLQSEMDKLSNMTKNGDKSYSDTELDVTAGAKLDFGHHKEGGIKYEYKAREANYGGVKVTETSHAGTLEVKHNQVKISHSESRINGSSGPATTKTAVNVKIPTELLHSLTHKMSDISKAIPEEMVSTLMMAMDSASPGAFTGVKSGRDLCKSLLKGALENMMKNPKGLAILQKGASTPHVEVVIGIEKISKPYRDASKPDVDRKSYFAIEIALEAQASADLKVPVAGALYVGASANISGEFGFYTVIPGLTTYGKKGEK